MLAHNLCGKKAYSRSQQMYSAYRLRISPSFGRTSTGGRLAGNKTSLSEADVLIGFWPL